MIGDILAWLFKKAQGETRKPIRRPVPKRPNAAPQNSGAMPNNKALVKMVEWLVHPTEYGRKPDFIQIKENLEVISPEGDKNIYSIIEYKYNEFNDFNQIGIVTSEFVNGFRCKVSQDQKMIYRQILMHDGLLTILKLQHANRYIEKDCDGTLELAGLTDVVIQQEITMNGMAYMTGMALKGNVGGRFIVSANDLNSGLFIGADDPFASYPPLYQFVGSMMNPVILLKMKSIK